LADTLPNFGVKNQGQCGYGYLAGYILVY